MKKSSKTILAIILSTSILLIGNNFSSASVPIPEKVRIGLYYETTALSSFNISAVKGMQLGYTKDNILNILYEEPTGNTLNIRKDTYYAKNGSTLTQYSPTDKTIPSGDKIGPYHIRIGDNYTDYNLVNQQIQAIKKKGIVAYQVFCDTWQIWTGYYCDQVTAQSDITKNLELVLGKGTYTVIQPSASRVVVASSTGDTLLIFESATAYLQIHPKPENSPCIFKINTKSYRGDLEVRRFTGSDMTLVNIIPLEQYLYGVVPAEIGANSNAEALKAQAVVARTFGLSKINEKKHIKWNFDLCSTVDCQVYEGYASDNILNEAPSANKAVDDTKGQIVTYNGKVASVNYFSSSGGRTEDSKNVWGGDLPYLKSVEDKYESGKSPNYNWEVALSAVKIKDILVAKGYDVGDILDITATKLSDTGRVIELVIKGTKDQKPCIRIECRTIFGLSSQWYSISTDSGIITGGSDSVNVKTQLGGKKVMTASGLNTLTTENGNLSIVGSDGKKTIVSTFFTLPTLPTLSPIPTTYKFTGKGYGHAVGMSQEGAKGMAKAGFKYDEILMHYFTGTKVE